MAPFFRSRCWSALTLPAEALALTSSLGKLSRTLRSMLVHMNLASERQSDKLFCQSLAPSNHLSYELPVRKTILWTKERERERGG